MNQDSYNSEGELANIHSAFHQGQYQKVIDFDTSSFSSSSELPVRILCLRAKLALGKHNEVLKDVKEESGPDFEAVRILAEYLKLPSETSPAVQMAEDLAGKDGDNLSVQLLCGTVLACAGEYEKALGVLTKHEGSLDAVALIVQIHLQQNRLDLATKEAIAARKWAQDCLLVNIVESWVGIREGGDKYQAAYYVFEELAQAAATQSVVSLVGQAVSEIHLGRLPEAEAAIEQAMQLDPNSPDALANAIVLQTVLGKDASELKKSLQRVNPKHELLSDLAEKISEFDMARDKYNPKLIK